MIRSPAGRLHGCTREQFELELDRIEVVVRSEEAGSTRLDIDSIFAKVGYLTTPDGDFLDVDTGAICRVPRNPGGDL